MKSANRRRTFAGREQLLVVAAVLICVVGAYGLLRIKSKEDELKLFGEERQRLQGEVAAGKTPRGGRSDLDEAQEQLKAAQAALDEKQRKLAEYTRDMVNAGSSDAVESVMLEITETANRHAVEVQQTEAYAGTVPGMPALATPAAAATAASAPRPGAAGTVRSLGGRPMRRLVLAGRYADLTSFMKNLHGMKNKVWVLSFTFKLADAKAAASPRLSAETVVML